MEKRNTNILKTLAIMLGVSLMALFTACSGDDTAETIEPSAQGAPYIMFGTQTEVVGWEPMVTSRASGDTTLTVATPASIGVWGWHDAARGMLSGAATEVFHNQQMWFVDSITPLNAPQWYNGWNYTNYPENTLNQWAYENPRPWLAGPDADNKVSYKFFIYTPYVSEGADGIECSELSYDGFKNVFLHKIPRYGCYNYMIADNVKLYKSLPVGAGQRNDTQKIRLQHVLSRLRFCFMLGDRYSELRRIHLKQVTVTNLQGYTFTLAVTYTPDGSGNFTPSYMWNRTPVSGEDSERTLINDQDVPYIELSKENKKFQPLASLYVYPNEDLPALDIKVVYDVYDIDGQLLRYNDSAMNTIKLNLKSSASSGEKVLRAGYYYDVHIKIEPTFLYALSDNDPHSDGYMIINP